MLLDTSVSIEYLLATGSLGSAPVLWTTVNSRG
jgi:hypothetical protein